MATNQKIPEVNWITNRTTLTRMEWVIFLDSLRKKRNENLVLRIYLWAGSAFQSRRVKPLTQKPNTLSPDSVKSIWRLYWDSWMQRTKRPAAFSLQKETNQCCQKQSETFCLAIDYYKDSWLHL